MRRWIFASLITVLLLTVAGCGSSNAAKNMSLLEKAKQDGYVTVGFANEVPWSYETEDGEISGEAIEVVKAVFKRMGIDEVKGVLTEFDSLVPGLKAKRFDMIAAAMFITPERAKEMAFANPDYCIDQALAVKKGNPLNLHSYEDIINNLEAKVVIMGGAIEANYLKQAGVQDEQVMLVSNRPATMEAVLSGRADATTLAAPTLKMIMEEGNYTEIERVMDFQNMIDGKLHISCGATAFRKEDNEIRQAFNKELEELKESGELLAILEEFGLSEEELPGDRKAEDLSK